MASKLGYISTALRLDIESATSIRTIYMGGIYVDAYVLAEKPITARNASPNFPAPPLRAFRPPLVT
jgi:hypothetical protein